MPQKIQIILASASPRRRDLLLREGVNFSILPTEVDETLDDLLQRQPEEAVKKLAERKAGAAVQQVLASPEITGAWAIIGADTIVVVDGRIFGKPVDAADARRMLKTLSGRSHQVITGVSVWLISAPDPENVSMGFRTLTETSHVYFHELDDVAIDAYVASGEPMDKAGAYAIQGGAGMFVDRVDGDYDNVVGLPVKRLMAEFPDIFASAR